MPARLRVALYWVPEKSDPLWEAGNRWLGRDPEHAMRLPQPPIPDIEALTEAPRLYGFHATLRPPMRLATGWDEFLESAGTLAGSLPAFDLPPLAVANLDGFLALRETAPCPDLHTLADACVRATNPHRLPPGPAELARRRAAALSEEEEQLLLRWGYPYVMQRWRFHMTLSRRLAPDEMASLRPAAEAHFAHALSMPRRASDIAIFTQRDDEPMLIAHRLRLRR